ncbi:MAG TPA: nickel-dependent lactate racemase [Thermodesulfobacteriota bacterium]
MKVHLAYGRGGLDVDLPDGRTTVIEPAEAPGLPDEKAAVLAALRQPIGAPPLREQVRATDRVVIVISDITRPTPNERLVPWLLEEIAHVPAERITILNGTGSHRANTEAELAQMLGRDVVARYRVVNHDAFDKAAHVALGRTSYGGEIALDRRYVEADARIVVGFVEPHFFAGFSGGPKGVMPALAAIDSIMHFHNAEMIGHPRATWGVLDGNPIQGEAREAVALVPGRPPFILNVTLNKRRAITGVFAGHVVEAHLAGVRFCRETSMRPVPAPFDVVVTTNGGYPLDQNLYQAVKGMSAAARIVRDGGAIVAAAECSDGLPAHGNFRKILHMRRSPGELLDMITGPGFLMYDQWQVQAQALVQRRARVYLKSSLPADEVTGAHLTPIDDVSAAVQALVEQVGPEARVAVLPQGPFTIPYVEA